MSDEPVIPAAPANDEPAAEPAEFKLSIGIADDKVRVTFGAPIESVEFDPITAVKFAQAIAGCANQIARIVVPDARSYVTRRPLVAGVHDALNGKEHPL